MSRPLLNMQWYKSHRQPRKRGVVLVCVIACLAVATLLLAGMLKRTLLTMRQIRTERHLRQTEWLVQAGVERAAFRLANDVEYTGEVWSLAAEEIAGTDPGVVNISVSRDSTDTASVQVVAEFPSGRVASIRRTRAFLIDLAKN